MGITGLPSSVTFRFSTQKHPSKVFSFNFTVTISPGKTMSSLLGVLLVQPMLYGLTPNSLANPGPSVGDIMQVKKRKMNIVTPEAKNASSMNDSSREYLITCDLPLCNVLVPVRRRLQRLQCY